MKLFTRMYDTVMVWARHKYATYYLCLLSFIESIFFPIPTDVMLAPMCLAQRDRVWRLAGLTTVFSALGGVVGFVLGAYLYEPVVLPLLEWAGYTHHFDHAVEWFKQYGVWVIFIAGFSPIPYKVFTIGAGVLSMAFLPFFLVSLLGRGLRFYLVAGLMRAGGARMEQKIRQYIEWLGWTVIIALVALYLMLR